MAETILLTPSWTVPTLAAAGLALSAVLVRMMIRLAVMDVPGDRSAHARPVPRGGGVGMVAAVLLGVPAGLVLLSGATSHAVPAVLLLGAVLLLAVVSWLDDLRQFSPLWKLAAQCVAAMLGVLAALAEQSGAGGQPGGGLLDTLHGIGGLPLLGFGVVGFCWLMLCTNAVNFMDGLNGLAAGVGALCGLFVLPVGLAMGDPLLAGAGLMLAAGLGGFLPFNFPRARIFMGDVGSQVCGLLVGAFALMLFADTGRFGLALAVPLILAGLLCDVLFTLCRRLLARERITQAHRGHLYQVAARSGISPVAVALMHWGFALWGAVVSLALLPGRPLVAVAMVLLPQLSWAMTVWLRAKRAGLGRWS